MLKNIANILKSSVMLRTFSEVPVPSIKKPFNSDDNNENQSSYTKTKTGSNSMILMASVALLMQKYKEAKCFFGRKTSKDNIESITSVSQYPANNPIEDRYASGKLTSVDGFAAGVFDGHGGWQVCKLTS